MINYVALQALLEQLKQSGYRHITVSPATHQIVNSRAENSYAHNITSILGWSRPFKESAIDPSLLRLMQQANILEHTDLDNSDGAWRSKIRISTIENQYFIHSAYPTSQNDAIFFGPDTYRFMHSLKHYFAENPASIGRAVDICTGCGPAAIQLARLFPQAEVVGVDINDTALKFAQFNASINQVENAQFVHSNLLHDIEGDFDFITANPPYLVDASKRTYRHGGGEYGYQLSLDILENALHRLKPGGTLLLYTGVAIVDGKDIFLHEVKNKLSATEFSLEYEEIDPDIFAEELLSEPYDLADRIAAVALTVRKPALPDNVIPFEHTYFADDTDTNEKLEKAGLDHNLEQAG